VIGENAETGAVAPGCAGAQQGPCRPDWHLIPRAVVGGSPRSASADSAHVSLAAVWCVQGGSLALRSAAVRSSGPLRFPRNLGAGAWVLVQGRSGQTGLAAGDGPGLCVEFSRLQGRHRAVSARQPGLSGLGAAIPARVLAQSSTAMIRYDDDAECGLTELLRTGASPFQR